MFDRFMKFLKSNLAAVVAVVAGAVAVAAGTTEVLAAPPAYVTDALTSAQTTLEEYVGAAAPKVLAAVAIVAALGLIVRLVKRALSGG